MFRYIHRHFLLLPRILLTLRHSTKRRADIYSPWFSGHRAICALQYKTKRENIKGLYLYFILFIFFILFSFHMDWLTLAICFFCCCVYMCALSPSRFSLPYILWTNYSDPRKVWRPALLPYYLSLSLFLVSVCDAGCFVYYVYHEPREEDEAAAQQLQRRETKQPNDPQEKEKNEWREREMGRCIFCCCCCVFWKRKMFTSVEKHSLSRLWTIHSIAKAFQNLSEKSVTIRALPLPSPLVHRLPPCIFYWISFFFLSFFFFFFLLMCVSPFSCIHIEYYG